jgi:hypothetical protein
MANTTNYNWETPDDTDLVKDGAAAIRTLGSSIDTTTKNLNPETTTGDISYRSATANVNTRLALGTAGKVLTVNSGATAPEWATPTTGGYTLLSTTALSGTSTTITSISGSYTDLVAYIDKVDFNSSAELNFQFNATANYYNNQLRNGVASYSGAQSKIRLTGSSVQFQGVFLYLPQYTRAFPKNGYAMEFDTNLGAVSWVHFADLNGAAVTQLVVTSQAGTSTMSGGNVYIYGVK